MFENSNLELQICPSKRKKIFLMLARNKDFHFHFDGIGSGIWFLIEFFVYFSEGDLGLSLSRYSKPRLCPTALFLQIH